jgi:hypothetical protein
MRHLRRHLARANRWFAFEMSVAMTWFVQALAPPSTHGWPSSGQPVLAQFPAFLPVIGGNSSGYFPHRAWYPPITRISGNGILSYPTFIRSTLFPSLPLGPLLRVLDLGSRQFLARKLLEGSSSISWRVIWENRSNKEKSTVTNFGKSGNLPKSERTRRDRRAGRPRRGFSSTTVEFSTGSPVLRMGFSGGEEFMRRTIPFFASATSRYG